MRSCSGTCHKLTIRDGWWCSRSCGHGGPCAARLRWWNLYDRCRLWGMR